MRAALLIALILEMGSSSAQVEWQLPQRNAGEYLAFGQIRAAGRMVDYCASAAPELKAQLDAAYKDLLERAMTAIAPTLKRIEKSAALSAPVAPDLVQASEDVANTSMNSIKSMSSREACSQVLLSVKGRTSEELRSRSEEVMERYEAFYEMRRRRRQ